MALIVEDGSIVTGANSYNTVIELRAYAEARGAELPAVDDDLESLSAQAMDYLESYRSRYQGTRVEPAVQVLQWPRSGVVIDGDYYVADDEIPTLLKSAQAQAVMESYDADLQPNDNANVKREQVDVIEIEYVESSTGGASFPKVDSLLDPILKQLSMFRSCRV